MASLLHARFYHTFYISLSLYLSIWHWEWRRMPVIPVIQEAEKEDQSLRLTQAKARDPIWKKKKNLKQKS
jgi:hypothetical protein